MMKKIFFISGSDHSGSTLIGCILGASTSPFTNFHVGEIRAYFNRNHRLYGDPRTARNRPYGKIWDIIDHRVGYKNAYQEIFKKTKAESIVDSSKDSKHFKKIIKSCDTNNYSPLVIVSFRPFAKIFESDIKRGKDEKLIIENISRYKNIKKQIIDLNYQYTIVNIEKLILNPKLITEKLCSSIGIKYFEGKENYWNFPSCHLYGSKTQRQHLKNPINATYDKGKVACKPSISHPFLERDDVRSVEDFFIQNALS